MNDKVLTDKDGDDEIIEVIETPDGQPPADAGAGDDDGGDLDDDASDDADDQDDGEEGSDKPRKPKRTHKERRDYRRQLEQAKDRELAELRQFRAAADVRFAALETNVASTSHTTYRQQLDQAEAIRRQSDDVIAAAVSAGNGADMIEAQKYRDQAIVEIARLTPLVEQSKQIETRLQGQPQAMAQEAARLQGQWKTHNPWYTGNPGDQATAMANQISQSLANEGFPPSTLGHWQELTRRLNSVFEKTTPQNGKADQQNGGRRGPPVNARRGEGGGAAGSRQVYLSPERVQAIKDAGKWDDVPERNKLIKAYQTYDRENAGQGVS